MSDWEIVPAESDWAVVKPDAAPEEGGPESFLHPDKFVPSPGHRKLKNTGPIADVRKDLDPNQVHVMSNEEAFTTPVVSLLDRATFGGLTGVMRLSNDINKSLGREPFYDRPLRAVEEYRRDPAANYTDIPAYFMAPTRALGAGASSLVGRGAQRLPEAAQAAMAKIPGQTGVIRTALEAGSAGGAMAGMNAASEGADPGAVARAMLHGGMDAATLGGGLAIGARGAGDIGRAVTESKGGKARQFLEEHGADVGPLSPGRGRVIDEMVTRGTSDADIGHQAEVSAQRGLDMLNEEKRAVLGVQGRRIGRVAESPEGAQLRDVSDIVQNMRDATTELDTSPQARAALLDLLKSVEAKQGQGFNPDVDTYMLSETDLNKLRRQLDRYAKTGTSTDASLSPLKSAASETRSMVDEGPFAEANAGYAKESKHYQKSRRLLGINERPKTPEESQTAVNKVKNLITRRGQNTVTAGGQEAKLAEFEQRHPDIAEEFARPEILRKRADISFSLLPKHGGLIDRMTHGNHSAAAIVAGMLHGGTGLIPSLTAMNLPAIQARLLYGPALAAQAAEPLFLGEIPQVAAARAAQEQR